MSGAPAGDGLAWFKSRRCDTSACFEAAVLPEPAAMPGAAEVAFVDGTYFLRNSAAPDVVVAFTAREWAAFAADLDGFRRLTRH